MNSYEPSMFYKTSPFDSLLEEAKMMEQQKALMYSYLPKEYQQMQKKAEAACDKMEYEGSRMYDEHPDRNVLRHLAKSLLEESEQDVYHEELMCCFLCNEIFLRRCRNWKSKKYIR